MTIDVADLERAYQAAVSDFKDASTSKNVAQTELTAALRKHFRQRNQDVPDMDIENLVCQRLRKLHEEAK